MSPRRPLSNAELIARYGDTLALNAAIRRHVEAVLAICAGPRQAAEVLGVGRSTLFRWVREWERREKEDGDD